MTLMLWLLVVLLVLAFNFISNLDHILNYKNVVSKSDSRRGHAKIIQLCVS